MFLRLRAGARRAGEAGLSFVGPDMTVTGNVETSGRLHIDGTIVGDVRCGVLVQGEKGCVTGNIFAGEARLAGLVDGGVEAGALALEASARVTGDVLYESVAIARGAEVEGRFRRRKAEGEGSGAAREQAAAAPPPRRGARGAKSGVAELFAPAPSAEAAE
jgi:cytoskeletal protein CcmA (bactofilin family)